MSKQIQAKANSFIRVPGPVPLNGAVTWNFHTEGQIGSRAAGDRYIYCADAASSSNYTNSSNGTRRNQPCLFVNGNRYNAIICSKTNTSSSVYWNATNCYAYADLKQKVDFGYDGSSYYLRTERYRDGTQKPLFEYNQNFGTQESCTSSNRYGGNNTPFAQGVSTSYAYFYNGGTTTYYNPTAIVVTQFEFTNYWSNTFTNPSSSSTVVPTSVKIDASNDNSNWTTLTTITSIPRTNSGKYYYDNPDTETAYHYYRFTFNATTGRPAVTSIRLHSDFFPVGWESDSSQTLATSTEHTLSSARVMLFNSYADISNCYLTQPMNLSETRITYTDSQEVEHTVFDGGNLINGNYVTTGVTLEDGIASGFNSQKFIVLPTPLGTTYANTTSLLTRFQYVRNSSNNYDYEQVLFYQQDTNARLTFLSSDLVALRIGSDVMVGRTKLTEGNWYFLYYVKDGNDHKVFLLEDNGEYIFNLLPRLPLVETDANNNLVHSASPWHYEFRMWYNAPIFSNYVLLGSRYAGNSAFRGKIDLNFTMFGNDVIHYNLHKDEYLDNGGYKSITEDTTINVPMSTGVVFDVDCTTEDAIIELTARGYEQSGTSITVAPGTVVYYNIHKKGYKSQTGSMRMESSYTMHVALEIAYSEYITMVHPFLEEDYQTQLTQLFNSSYFYRNPTLEAITNTNTSSVHNINYVSYFTFHTGDDPDVLMLTVKGYVSGSSGDWGGVYVTSAPQTITRDWVVNGTTYGDGYWMFRQTGTSNSLNTYTKKLQPDTDYYLYLCWTKDSSSTSGSDALVVKEITFPAGKALKTLNYTSVWDAELEDGTPLPTSKQTFLQIFETPLLPNARLTGEDAEKGYTFEGWYINDQKVTTSTYIPVGTTEMSANWSGDEIRFTLVPSEPDAIVTLTAPRAVQSGNSIDVHPLTTVKYTVKKKGFKTVTGTYDMEYDDYTLNLILEASTELWYCNFNADAYLTIPNATIGTADQWEEVWHVRTGQYNWSNYYISCGNNATCHDIGIAGSKIWKMFLSSNGSSWDIVNGATKNIVCNHNTNYWVKTEFTGTKYNMYVATDAQHENDEWTLVAEHTSSTKVFAVNSYRIGTTYDKYWAWPGFIDIGNSYIAVNHKVNGEDNWTYDFNGGTAELNTDYSVVGSLLCVEDEMPPVVSLDTSDSNNTGKWVNTYTNTESQPTTVFRYSESPEGSYNRWQSYGTPAATAIYTPDYYMKAKYVELGIWHEEGSFNDRVANAWNVWVANDWDGINVNDSNWKNKCTCILSVSGQLPYKLTSYTAEQGKMKMFEIPAAYRDLIFNGFVIEVTNNRGGYSNYTDTYRAKIYGEVVEDPHTPCTFTVDCDKEDATIVLSCPNAEQHGNSITGRLGQTVTYSISKEGYQTVSGTHVLESDYELTVTMIPYVPPYSYGTEDYPLVDCYLRGAFGGQDWPASAEYQFRYDEDNGVFFLRKDITLETEWKIGSYDWQSINFGAGQIGTSTVVIPMDTEYQMDYNGGNCAEPTPRQVSTIVLNPSTGRVHLYPYGPVPEEEYTLYVFVDPDDAEVTLTSPGFEQEFNSITTHPGAVIHYVIAKEGYKTIRGTYTMGEDDEAFWIEMEEGTDYRSLLMSGFTGSHYVTPTPTVNGSSSFTFITSFTSTNNYLRWIASPTSGADNPIYINYDGYLTVWYSGEHGYFTPALNTRYWFRAEWLNNTTLKWGVAVDDNETYHADTLPDLSNTSFWNICYNGSCQNSFAGTQIGLGVYLVMTPYDEYAFSGTIDLGKTMYIDNGVVTFNGNTAVEGVDYTNTGVTITEQPWPNP